MRGLLIAAALLTAAQAGAAEDPGSKVIRLVFLKPGARISAADAAEIAAEATAVYKKLGLGITVQLVPGNPVAFDPAKLPKDVAFAVLGEPRAVRAFVAKKDPKNGAYLETEGWPGGETYPECSQNDFVYGDTVMGGRVIALDANALDAFGAFSPTLKWTRVQAGAFLLVHGSGHNADSYNKLKHYGAGIMADGAARKGSFATLSAAQNAYEAATAPGNQDNQKLALALRARFL